MGSNNDKRSEDKSTTTASSFPTLEVWGTVLGPKLPDKLNNRILNWSWC